MSRILDPLDGFHDRRTDVQSQCSSLDGIRIGLESTSLCEITMTWDTRGKIIVRFTEPHRKLIPGIKAVENLFPHFFMSDGLHLLFRIELSSMAHCKYSGSAVAPR